jgi:hypothetical protein
MKVGDHVYLITDQLQTGSGIPGIIYAVQDSTEILTPTLRSVARVAS